jgi:beta-galactosidase beta subunit
MYTGHVDFMRIAEGYCYVAYPEDGHMPGVHLDAPKDYTKLVVKLKV